MPIGLLTLKIHLPGCGSLKEKRRRLKPLLARLHREFNISVTECGHHDVWQTATIACALVSTESGHAHRSLLKVVSWVETHWLDVTLEDDQIEII